MSQLQLHVGLVSREICIKTDGGDDNSWTLLDARQDPCFSNGMIIGIFCSDTQMLLGISPVSYFQKVSETATLSKPFGKLNVMVCLDIKGQNNMQKSTTIELRTNADFKSVYADVAEDSRS